MAVDGADGLIADDDYDDDIGDEDAEVDEADKYHGLVSRYTLVLCQNMLSTVVCSIN